MHALSACSASQPRSLWAQAALVGQAHWFFGNLYESLVGMPQLLADAQPRRAPRLLGVGSPIRYYIPVAPLTLATTTIALLDSWRTGGDKRLIITAAASMATATALSAHLIRTVNMPLLRADRPLNAADRRQLISTWHRTNVVRLVALATAFLSARTLQRSWES